MTVTDYWSGEGEAPLPRPDQYESRDATEERLTRELMPVAETFAVLLSERLVHDIGQLYTDPSSLSAAGPLKPPPPPKGFNPANPKSPPPPKGFNPADPNWQRLGETLWQEALRSRIVPGLAETYAIYSTLPEPLQKQIQETVKQVGTAIAASPSTAMRAKIAQDARKAILAPSRDFVRYMARTEATRAWNERYWKDARKVVALHQRIGRSRPTLKRWVSLNDTRTRDSHAAAHGQVVFLSDNFTVGGHAMLYPGDRNAPAAEVVNCRCVMEIFQTTETEVADMQLLLASGAQGVTWSGTLVFEGEQTGDGRLIEKDALYWEDGGVPLRAVLQDVGAHDGAVVVGRITDIQRSDDGRIGASGFLDLGSEAGREMRRLMAQNLYNGVSVDLDDVSFEVRVRPELLDEDGDPPALEPLPSPDEMEVVHEHKSDDEVMVITSARIRAATLVAIPAFANARIDLDDVNDIPDDQPVSDEAVAAAALDDDESPAFVIVASANADCPPAEWFENPGLSGPTALTVTEGGRVFGHLATWGTEHLTHPGVTPPRSSSDYRYFHTGATLLSNGHQIPTGRLTVDTGHAAEDAAPLRAMAHYDNTGTAVADVCVGEDSHGIWFAGAVRPTATDEQVRVLRGSPLSGDWRRIGGSLELVAALAVNVGGFPVPRGLVASGHMQSLITSTALPPNLSQKFVALTVDQAEKLDRVIDILDRKDQHHKAKVLTAAATVRNKLTAQRAEALAQILKDKKEG